MISREKQTTDGATRAIKKVRENLRKSDKLAELIKKTQRAINAEYQKIGIEPDEGDNMALILVKLTLNEKRKI